MKRARATAQPSKSQTASIIGPARDTAAIVEAFDKISPEYGGPADGGRPDLQAKARTAAIKLLAAEDHRSILDAGCGNGALMLELIKKGYRGTLVGADFSGGMLKVLTEREKSLASQGHRNDQKPYLCRALLEQLPFPANSFDAVVCVNTLHNLPSEEAVVKAVREFMRVCKTSGQLILQIHNANNPLVRRHFALYSRSYMPLRSYTAKWLGAVLASGGFEVTKKVPLGFPLSTIAPFLVIKAEKF